MFSNIIIHKYIIIILIIIIITIKVLIKSVDLLYCYSNSFTLFPGFGKDGTFLTVWAPLMVSMYRFRLLLILELCVSTTNNT